MHIFLTNIWKFGKKVSNIKKLIVNIYIKKINTKESFECFYILVILIDSVYRKDENILKFLEKIIYKFF